MNDWETSSNNNTFTRLCLPLLLYVPYMATDGDVMGISYKVTNDEQHGNCTVFSALGSLLCF